MNTKQLNIMLWVIFCSLIVIGCSLLMKAWKSPQFDAISALSGSATFVIALLTVIYVATNRSQFEIMSKQLDEMMKNRELTNQPLPWPIKLEAYSEKPRFFYSPPEKEYKVVSRHFINFELKNIGSTPAVSIDVCCSLIIPDIKENILLTATSNRIDVLEDSQIYPSKEEKKDRFLFSGDRKAKLFHRLIEGSIKYFPIIELNIFFKNILGACFHIKRNYRLYANEGDRGNIKVWLEKLTTFPIRNMEKIKLLYNQRNSRDDKIDSLFDELKDECDSGLSVDQINYIAWPIPTSGEVACITSSEYERAVSNLSYGVLVIGSVGCISDEGD